MRIISSAESGYSWVVELFRTPVAVSLQDADSFAVSLNASLGLTYQEHKGRQYLSCCKSAETIKLADLGHAVSLWGSDNGERNFVYLETVNDEVVAVVVVDGLPVFDGLIRFSDINILLNNHFAEAVRVFVGGQFEPDTIVVGESELVPVERLTVNLNTRLSELKPLSVILANNVSPLISLIAVLVLVMGAVIGGWLLFFDVEEPVAQDPYESFYSFLSHDSINVLNRANQDYNEQIKLLSLHGWQLKSVNYTRASVAYEVEAKSDGLAEPIGDIATLERYAAINNLTVLFEPGKRESTAILMAVASNVPATKDYRLYNVEQMFRTLKDAIELYIPGATVEFVREVGQAGSTWKKREIVVSLAQHDVRYLNTLGAIIEELPVTFGGDKTDMQIGKLALDENGALSGSLKLTLIGE